MPSLRQALLAVKKAGKKYAVTMLRLKTEQEIEEERARLEVLMGSN